MPMLKIPTMPINIYIYTYAMPMLKIKACVHSILSNHSFYPEKNTGAIYMLISVCAYYSLIILSSVKSLKLAGKYM